MTIVWLIIEAMFLFLFYQLPSVIESEQPDVKRTNRDKHKATSFQDNSVKTVSGSCESDVYQSLKSNESTSLYVDSTTGEEATPLLSTQPNTYYSLNRGSEKQPPLPSEETHNSNNVGAGSESTSDDGNVLRGWNYVVFVVSSMVREEIVVLLAVIFLTVFSQTAIEVNIFYICIYTTLAIKLKLIIATIHIIALLHYKDMHVFCSAFF